MKGITSVKGIYPFRSYGGVEKYIYTMAGYLAFLNIGVEIVAQIYKRDIKHG